MDRSKAKDQRDSRSRSPYKSSRSQRRSRSPYRSPHRDSHRSHHKRRHHEADTNPPLPFGARPLSKHDRKTYEPMLALYLDIQKTILIEDLSTEEVKGRWKSFLGKWNRGDLAEGWYDPKTLEKALNQAAPPTTNPPQQPSFKKRKQNAESATALDSNSDSESSSYGPSLPFPSSHLSHGPTIPQTQDLTLSRELSHSASLTAQSSSLSQLHHSRRSERTRRATDLEDVLAPRPSAGTHARQLENRAIQRASNAAFADRASALDADDAADAENAMGGGGNDSISDLKRLKEKEEKKKNERELRREETLRARRAEREERMRGIREKEERTMEGLRELARVRFGGGGGGGEGMS